MHQYLTREYYFPKNKDGSINEEQKIIQHYSVKSLQRYFENDVLCRQKMFIDFFHTTIKGLPGKEKREENNVLVNNNGSSNISTIPTPLNNSIDHFLKQTDTMVTTITTTN